MRRHHNNRGEHQVRQGKTRAQVAGMAKRLKIPVATDGFEPVPPTPVNERGEFPQWEFVADHPRRGHLVLAVAREYAVAAEAFEAISGFPALDRWSEFCEFVRGSFGDALVTIFSAYEICCRPSASGTPAGQTVVHAAEAYALRCVQASGQPFDIGQLIRLKDWFYAGARWRASHPDGDVDGPTSTTM
jgi:hypothetical protein